jgi:hypothetical protein
VKSKYVISKKQCEDNIKGVCEGCGGKLSAIKTVDNSGNPTYWQGCKRCMCFRGGIELKYFKVARILVEEGECLPYSSMRKIDYQDTPERIQYYFDTQTAGLSYTIKRIHKLLDGEDHVQK